MKKIIICAMFVCLTLCFFLSPFRALEMYYPYQFFSEEEYNHFLETEEIPADFVRYQDISFLGSFQEFCTTQEDVSTYSYFINCPHENERTIIFTLKYFERFKPSSNVVNAPEDNNFAQNSYAEEFYKSNTEECSCQVGNVFYRYNLNRANNKTNLTEIEWIDPERNLWFSLRGDFDCCLREFGAPETAVEARNRLLEATGCSDVSSVEQYTPTYCSTAIEYLHFLETRSIPANFVRYEDIYFVGNFRYFYAGGDDSLSMYWYTLGCPKENHSMEFRTLSPWKFTPPQNIVAAPEDLDFAKIGDATGEDAIDFKDSVYQVGNVFYYYNGHHPSSEQASLRGIRWVDPERGIWYSISGFSKCCLQQFKDPETAVEARNRLLEATGCAFSPEFDPSNVFDTPSDIPAEPTPFPWLWVIVPAGVVLIAAATAALVIRKKKSE